MFQGLSSAPPDAILGLTEAFKKDTNPNKINLGVGVYKDEEGRTPILHCVKEAEQRLVDEETTKSYMPMGGAPEYAQAVQSLLLGEAYAGAGRVRTAHTPGGTGGLRVGAESIHLFAPQASIWLSTPTWANHRAVFSAAGLPIREYPYYDPATKGVEIDALLESLQGVPAGDVVLLHVCCHNPTGVDLNVTQWRQVAAIAAERGWTPFLDFAYQGFGEGLVEDAAGLAPFLETGIEMWIASSFSKNFGLYCERTGAVTLLAADANAAETAFGHVELLIRRNYSNPPAHGGRIVTTVLGDDRLRGVWLEELSGMRERVRSIRAAFAEGLRQRGVERDFSFIQAQRGMFSFSGLNDAQVDRLRAEYGIYIVKGGRINVAGVTTRNLDYLCDAIAAVL